MRPLAIYRPNSDIQKGGAVQFHMGTNKRGIPAIYVEAAKQIKDKSAPGSTESPFDWANKLRMMLNAEEIGEILSSITGLNRKEVKLVHKSLRSDVETTAMLNLSPPLTEESKKYGNWAFDISISTKDGRNSVRIFISPSQLIQFRILGEETLRRFFNADQSFERTSGSKASK